MKQPFVATASDGASVVPTTTVPHPRSYGCFPRKIGRYAIDDRIITEIVYKARGVKKPPARVVVLEMPDEAELDAVLLDAAEIAELNELINGLDSIPSERIRSAISSRMTRDVKLKHWRLERGWKLCRFCLTIYKPDVARCPACRRQS